MVDDTVTRFLKSLSPTDRDAVRLLPRDQRERLADAWEEELVEDHDLDTLSELSPPAAESEAARRVIAKESG
ncbi:hypothetical protein ABT354_02590 [Streptomyces sp. NPDC000594]|uniref:hypothetical protein n=1 Tax=Streptomyces sp. NPDC000594 TaxID=3154261 RepID=UPI003331F6F5